MKLKITAAQREEVKSHRAFLDEKLKQVMGHEKSFGKLADQLSGLQIEIREIETAEPSKESARLLADKRAELELCERRLAERMPTDPNAEAALRGVLRESTQLMNRVLLPTITDFLVPIIAAIRPFTSSDGEAGKLARETKAYKFLRGRLFWDYGSQINAVTAAVRALQRYDEVLAGEIIWNFNPKIS